MYREQIEQYIDAHKEEMLADIIELCKIDSAKGPYEEGKPFGEGPFQALAKGLEIGEKHGFAITNYDNYVGTIDLNDKEKQLDILAHLDIVPGGEGWTVTTPFEPVIKDGKIYGRGTSDDKGPAMTALYAMKAIKELGIPVKKNVRLILGTDEECGSSDIRYYYKKEEEAPMSFSPDAEFPVINLEKGSIHGEFNAQFEKCEALPKMVAFKSGVKSNVVPPKAYALFDGLDGSETEAFAKQFEAELGVTFDVTSENGFLKLEAVGESAHASTPEKGTNALTALLAMVEKLNLAMNLIDVEYTFDNSKLIFYFTAETRIDFRELVKELASVFRTRIELRQIGVRDEAKMLGGLGVCGRSVCCNSFLGDFAQVSIKMAKDQGLSLNSAKISGACGKLMCCLRYEDKVYEEEMARTPKVGSVVETSEGRGVVTEALPLKGIVKVTLEASPETPPKPFDREAVKVVGFNKAAVKEDAEEMKKLKALEDNN